MENEVNALRAMCKDLLSALKTGTHCDQYWELKQEATALLSTYTKDQLLRPSELKPPCPMDPYYKDAEKRAVWEEGYKAGCNHIGSWLTSVPKSILS